MHVSSSTTYLASPAEIASTGHTDAQEPQLTHSSEIKCAMTIPPWKIYLVFNSTHVLYLIYSTVFSHNLQQKIFSKPEFFWLIIPLKILGIPVISRLFLYVRHV
jgi:hypothetical protein